MLHYHVGGEYWDRTSRAKGAGFTVQCITIDASSPLLATPHGFEPRRSVLETDMLPLTSGSNMEVRVRFELTIVEICSHLPWTTRPPHRNKLITKMY
jgi:hypothetical protein